MGLIWDRAPISRAELVSASGLAPSSVTRLIQELGQSGLVRESGKGRSSGGRQPLLLEPDGSAGFVIGVDLSGTEMRAGSFDAANRQLHLTTERFVDVGPDAITSQIAAVVERVATSTGPDPRLIGIGLSVPGSVDTANGVVLESYLLRLVDVPLGRTLAVRFGVPVVLEHDASVAALAERFYGAGRGLDDLIYVLVANGIGSGILLGGHVYPGRSGRSGQLGHVIFERNGPLCVCGSQGCLEALAAGPAIAAHAGRMIDRRSATSIGGPVEPEVRTVVSEIVAAADAGDPIATSILSHSADYLALGIVSYVRLFDIEHVIVGGEVVEDSATYFSQLERSLDRYMGRLGTVTLCRGELRQGDHIRGLSRLTIEQSVRALLGITQTPAS
jgi:predicted NBD/HSP70 family sugar kinase